jgi:hypothetical protein
MLYTCIKCNKIYDHIKNYNKHLRCKTDCSKIQNNKSEEDKLEQQSEEKLEEIIEKNKELEETYTKLKEKLEEIIEINKKLKEAIRKLKEDKIN